MIVKKKIENYNLQLSFSERPPTILASRVAPTHFKSELNKHIVFS